MGITALAIFSTASVILMILINLGFWKFWKKKDKETSKGEKEKPPDDQENEEPVITEFMVGYEEKKKEEEEKPEEEKIYNPGEGVGEDKVISSEVQDSDHLWGHEVSKKELPTPEEEVVDFSWVNLEVNRDLKHVLKELEGKDLNCYDILGVGPNASKGEIKKAYRNLANRYHPDKGVVLEGEMIDRIQDINYSKEILLDPTMRALHDEMLREQQKASGDAGVTSDVKFDPDLFEQLELSDEEEIEDNVTFAGFVDEIDGMNGLGVLYFRKWDEDFDGFNEEIMEYFMRLDEEGYIDYGMVMKGDIDDMEDIVRMKRISNFPMAVNNTLFDVWERPPFYYLAVPILKREHVQGLCEILKESFSLESIFFKYPVI